ncbi:MAG: SulP family inorganic anion transporter [Planctomycetes bacterium]|nr:SulP family inorganic anion transporter [Planctomycetota bacterium]
MTQHTSLFAYPRQDFVAGIVVFLVAVPLCLGIALASGVPAVSGLVAGAVGGLVVPWISRSALSVSGPAAGLTAIVLLQVGALGGLPPFLLAVLLAGGMQIALGMLRAGRLSGLVPSAVVKGMLASIGIVIVMKQIPVAFGSSGELSALFRGDVHAGSALIAALSLVVLYGWKKTPLARFQLLSPALVVVVMTSALGAAFAGLPALALSAAEFVDVPLGGFAALIDVLPRPELGAIVRSDVWIAAGTIAVVASIETLLSIQAVDRLDPLRRHSPPDRELVAQGVGNVASGFLGGLPITAVIVRSGANVAAGGRERLSAIVHGLLLVGAVAFAGSLLNRIPLAALAAVLIQVGLNLCKPALFRQQLALGINQLLPFAVTIAAVLATDLLKGVIIGIVVGIFFVLRQNAKDAVSSSRREDGARVLRFERDATFITKPQLLAMLDEVEDGERVVIDGTGEYMDQDVKESLALFTEDAAHRRIQVELVGIDLRGAPAGGGH